MDFAPTLDEAIKKIRLNDYDAVLMDTNVDTPSHNGLDLTKKIRKEHNSVPIFGTSAGAEVKQLKEMFFSGMDGFFPLMALEEDDVKSKFFVWYESGIINPDKGKSIESPFVDQNQFIDKGLKRIATEGIKNQEDISFLLEKGFIKTLIRKVEQATDQETKDTLILKVKSLFNALESSKLYKLMTYKQIMMFESLQADFYKIKKNENKWQIEGAQVKEALLEYLKIPNSEKEGYSISELRDKALNYMTSKGHIDNDDLELLVGGGNLFYYMVKEAESSYYLSQDLFWQITLIQSWLLDEETLENVVSKYPVFTFYNTKALNITKTKALFPFPKPDIKADFDLKPRIK